MRVAKVVKSACTGSAGQILAYRLAQRQAIAQALADADTRPWEFVNKTGKVSQFVIKEKRMGEHMVVRHV